MINFKINKEYFDFLRIINSKSKYQQTLIYCWILLPFIMMLSKSLADFFISLIAVSFLIKSSINFSWSWLKIRWVRWAILFFATSIFSGLLSSLSDISISNGISWIRFPIFALAVSIWLIKEKQILYISLFINFLSLIFIFLLMGLETIFTDHTMFTWPFRNPLNGPFIHRIGIIFFCLSTLLIFSNNKYKYISLLFFSISVLFSLLSGHRVGTFSFVIIISMSFFWPNLNLRRSMNMLLLFSSILFIYFIFNPKAFDRYFIEIINFSNTSLLQYIGLWKTGLISFIENPIVGLGPTNVQNYLELNLIENFDPFINNEHPHNHYIQAFSETGILGGGFYCLMIISLIANFYKKPDLGLDTLDEYLKASIFICSICLLWPFANTYDLFGQQQNGFLWYCLSLYILINSILSPFNFSQDKLE